MRNVIYGVDDKDTRPKLVATVRCEHITNNLALFYYDERKDLICYTESEGHSQCSVNYYRTKTSPLSIDEKPLIDRFIKRYENIGNVDIKVILKKRISLYDNATGAL